jgi:mRNA interferase MazF
MRRGEVYWYKFTHPDKKRPVLILTRNSILEYLGEVTVAPLTTTIRNIPSEVVVGRNEGLERDCAVNCDHIQTVPKSKLGGIIATLPANKLNEVRQAIHFSLGL